MSKKPLILGIESSCDETASSLITENEQGIPVVLSNIVSSQIEEHKEFGGIVPEIAARAHVEKIDCIVKKAIKESKVHAQWVANYLINKLGISETRIQIVFGIKGDGSLVTLEGVFE